VREGGVKLKVSAHRLIAYFCVSLIVITLAISASRFMENKFSNTEPFYMDTNLKKYNDNFLITVSSKDSKILISSVEYTLEDNCGHLVSHGNLSDIYELDNRFLDENFVPVEAYVMFHDNKSDWRIGNNDIIILRSTENGGVAKENFKFFLTYVHTDSPFNFVEIFLRDDIPNSTIPSDRYNVPDYFKLNKTSMEENSSLTIALNHVAFSSIKAVIDYPIYTGITLINNSTKRMENVSIVFYDQYQNRYGSKKDIMYETTNISLAPGSMKRVVFSYVFDDGGGRTHNITAEINGDGMENPLIASINIPVVCYVLE